MKVARDEQTIVALVGKRLVKNALCKVNKIVVFKKEEGDGVSDNEDGWKKVNEYSYYKPKDVSIKFEFCND